MGLYLESASQVDMRTTVREKIVSREKGFYRSSIVIRGCPFQCQACGLLKKNTDLDWDSLSNSELVLALVCRLGSHSICGGLHTRRHYVFSNRDAVGSTKLKRILVGIACIKRKLRGIESIMNVQ